MAKNSTSKKVYFETLHLDKTRNFSGLKNSMGIVTKSLERVNKSFEKMKRNISLATSKLRGMSTKMAHVFPQVSKSTSGLIGMGARIAGVGSIGGVVGAGAAAATAAAAYSLGASAGFEESAIKLKAVSSSIDELGKKSKITQKDFKALTDTAKELGSTTQFAPREILDSMKTIASTGSSDQKSILSLIQPILNLTGAERINTPIEADRVAEILTGTLSAFQLNSSEAGVVSDKLAFASSESSQNLEDLAQALKTFAPLAKNAGIGLDETLALLMELSSSNIKESIAGTALSGFTARMLSLPKEGRESFEEYFTLKEQKEIINENGTFLKDGMTKLFELFQKNKVPLHAQVSILGGEAGKYLVSLTGKQDIIREKMNSIGKESFGYAAKLNETNIQGLNGKLRRLSASVSSLGIALGETAFLDNATGFVDNAVKMIHKLNSFFKNLPDLGSNILEKIRSINPPKFFQTDLNTSALEASYFSDYIHKPSLSERLAEASRKSKELDKSKESKIKVEIALKDFPQGVSVGVENKDRIPFKFNPGFASGFR